ncbi:hypothetical protein ACFLZZ_01265 [Nanoarchaeota archaeon]
MSWEDEPYPRRSDAKEFLKAGAIVTFAMYSLVCWMSALGGIYNIIKGDKSELKKHLPDKIIASKKIGDLEKKFNLPEDFELLSDRDNDGDGIKDTYFRTEEGATYSTHSIEGKKSGKVNWYKHPHKGRYSKEGKVGKYRATIDLGGFDYRRWIRIFPGDASDRSVLYGRDEDNDGRLDEVVLQYIPKGHDLEKYADVKTLDKIYRQIVLDDVKKQVDGFIKEGGK